MDFGLSVMADQNVMAVTVVFVRKSMLLSDSLTNLLIHPNLYIDSYITNIHAKFAVMNCVQ